MYICDVNSVKYAWFAQWCKPSELSYLAVINAQTKVMVSYSGVLLWLHVIYLSM